MYCVDLIGFAITTLSHLSDAEQIRETVVYYVKRAADPHYGEPVALVVHPTIAGGKTVIGDALLACLMKTT